MTTDVLEILDPGLLASIQDVGRPGLGSIGVPRGGAADRWALGVANVLVGNDPGAAAIELTLPGAAIRAIRPLTVGFAGTLAARVRETGARVSPGVSVRLDAGWTLDIDGGGMRGYLAVPGGIDVPLVLGARSTALGAGFGGFEGRPLRAGDRLAAATPVSQLEPAPARWAVPAQPLGALRVLPGPHADDLGARVIDALLATSWTVADASDRVGLRLDGQPIAAATTGELASHGVISGAIQLPPDGRPIVLLVDCQPTGGYPVPVVVIAADLGRLAQMPPGSAVTFELTTPETARAALADEQRAFAAGIADLREAAGWDGLWQGAEG